jgi:hypothetical protein
MSLASQARYPILTHASDALGYMAMAEFLMIQLGPSRRIHRREPGGADRTSGSAPPLADQVFETTANKVFANVNIPLAVGPLLTHEWSCQKEPSMPILFNKTIQQCRLLGARGGRAYGRNLRLRKLQASTTPPAPPLLPRTPQSVHEASLLLDRRFPWLAEAFRARRRP